MLFNMIIALPIFFISLLLVHINHKHTMRYLKEDRLYHFAEMVRRGREKELLLAKNKTQRDVINKKYDKMLEKEIKELNKQYPVSSDDLPVFSYFDKQG